VKNLILDGEKFNGQFSELLATCINKHKQRLNDFSEPSQHDSYVLSVALIAAAKHDALISLIFEKLNIEISQQEFDNKLDNILQVTILNLIMAK